MEEMFLNVNDLLDLIDCIMKRNPDTRVKETLDEVESIIMDLEWKKI